MEQARDIIQLFEMSYGSLVIPVKPIHFTKARQWVSEMSTSLRTFDALHLAIAEEASCTLITADKQLAAAAARLSVDHYVLQV